MQSVPSLLILPATANAAAITREAHFSSASSTSSSASSSSFVIDNNESNTSSLSGGGSGCGLQSSLIILSPSTGANNQFGGANASSSSSSSPSYSLAGPIEFFASNSTLVALSTSLNSSSLQLGHLKPAAASGPRKTVSKHRPIAPNIKPCTISLLQNQQQQQQQLLASFGKAEGGKKAGRKKERKAPAKTLRELTAQLGLDLDEKKPDSKYLARKRALQQAQQPGPSETVQPPSTNSTPPKSAKKRAANSANSISAVLAEVKPSLDTATAAVVVAAKSDEPKPKRKRRSKAQIELENQAKRARLAEESASLVVVEKKPTRKPRAKRANASSSTSKSASITVESREVVVDEAPAFKFDPKEASSSSSSSLTSTTAEKSLTLSQTLFDSIQYISTSWPDQVKTGNETSNHAAPPSSSLLSSSNRPLRCVRCLKPFHLAASSKGDQHHQLYDAASGQTVTLACCSYCTEFMSSGSSLQMNTSPPPPPLPPVLQPIAEEAAAGMYSYFNAAQQPMMISTTTSGVFVGSGLGLSTSQYVTNGSLTSSVSSSSSSSLSPSSSSTATASASNRPLQINPTSQQQAASAALTSNIQLFSPHQSTYLPVVAGGTGGQHQINQGSFSIGSVSSISSSHSNLEFEDEQADSYQDSNSDRLSHMSIKERRQSLNRKLAQRPQKKELVDLGILPSSRVPPLHYDQARHLEKAQIHDILKTKIERRPKRELLIQKNILPDSKAAPSLQLKCNELKRARLADDLNEKLAKRPGPLELVESGILVASDSNFTDAIKDGKIAYPRTSFIHAKPFNPPDEAFLSNFNFNFNLVDNDESNASQASTSTNKTSTSSVTSFSSASLNFGGAPASQQQIPSFPAGLFQTSSNAPSPASSISTNATLSNNANKFSASPSPSSSAAAPGSSSWDYVRAGSASTGGVSSSTNNHHHHSHHRSSKPKAFKSYSSASSTSSKAGQSGPAKKVSQLIMHEYNGPNQKSSKSVLSLSSHAKGSLAKSAAAVAKKEQAHKNGPSSTSGSVPLGNAAAVPAVASASSAGNTGAAAQTGLAEFLFDGGSNDSSPMTLPNDEDNDEPLNPYEIRLRQQQMFLEHDRTPTNQESMTPFMVQQEAAIANGSGFDPSNGSADLELSLNDFINLPGSANILSPDFENTLLGIDIGTANGASGQVIVRNESLHEMLNSAARFEDLNATVQLQSAPEQLPTIHESATPANSKPTKSSEKQQQQQVGVQAAQPSALAKIDEMNINELRDECRRLKVKVTGNKNVLIERLKAHYSQQLSQQPAESATIKAGSPSDSNAEGSPSFSGTSGEPSPSLVVNSQPIMASMGMMGYMEQSGNGASGQQLHYQQTALLVNESTGEMHAYNGAIQLSGSLEDHPHLNSLMNGSTSDPNGNAGGGLIFDPASSLRTGENELKLNTFKTNISNEFKAPQAVAEPPLQAQNFSAELQMQFENTSELLKKCSSNDELNMEDIHRLEMQVQESMKLIERLKSSKTTTTTNPSIQQQQQSMVQASRLRQISSMPSNLKDLNDKSHLSDPNSSGGNIYAINVDIPHHQLNQNLQQSNQIEILNGGLDSTTIHYQMTAQDGSVSFNNGLMNGKDSNGGFMFVHNGNNGFGVENGGQSQIPVNRANVKIATTKNTASLPSIYSLIGNEERNTSDNLGHVDHQTMNQNMNDGMQQQQQHQQQNNATEFDLNEFDFSDLDMTTPTVGNLDSGQFRYPSSAETTTTNGDAFANFGQNDYQHHHHQQQQQQQQHQQMLPVQSGSQNAYLNDNLIPLNNIKQLQLQAELILKNNGRQTYLTNRNSNNTNMQGNMNEPPAYHRFDNAHSQHLIMQQQQQQQQQQNAQMSLGQGGNNDTLSGMYIKNNGANIHANFSLIDEQYIQ